MEYVSRRSTPEREMRATTTTHERERHYYKIKHKTKRGVKSALSSERSAFCPPRRRKVSSSLLLCADARAEREKSERKSLGFHIQLGFKAMLLDRQITSLPSLFTRTTRASGSFGKEKQKRAAFINVFLSLVFCFVFCALYSNRHRHYKYKREFVLGKNPRFSVSRYALCSLVLV